MTILYLYEHGTKINWKENTLIIKKDEIIKEVPIENTTGLVLFGNIQLTDGVVKNLLIRNIPVSWLSKKGRFYGRLESTTGVNIKRQRQQFKVAFPCRL